MPSTLPTMRQPPAHGPRHRGRQLIGHGGGTPCRFTRLAAGPGGCSVGCSMAEQAAALISAASVLAGVALTGTFTLLKGRQERLDKQLDRDEQRRIMHREARRDAYAQFLAAYHEVDRKFEQVKKIFPASDSEQPVAPQLPAVEEAIIALKEAGSTVSLEGPPELSEAANRLCSACIALLHAFVVLSASNRGDSRRLWAYDSPDRDGAENEMDQAGQPSNRRPGRYLAAAHPASVRDDTRMCHDEAGTDAERPHRPAPHRGSSCSPPAHSRWCVRLMLPSCVTAGVRRPARFRPGSRPAVRKRPPLPRC